MNLPALTADWPGRDSESLVWLASYPRSGNTFTRILLANYLASEGDAYDLNLLQDFIPSDTNENLWKSAGIPPIRPDDWEGVWKARPTVFAHYRKTKGRQALSCLKTHSANIITFGAGGFDFRENDRALYIVRHPLDVLISLADFNGRDIESTIDVMTCSGFAVRKDGSGRMEVRGSWGEHVASWISSAPCPLLLVRYEELAAETERTLRDILSFLGIPIVERRVQQALALSRFDKLREQEAEGSFIESHADTTSGRFFREGKSLQWLGKLGPEQASRLADACEKIMTPLGYTHPREVLFGGSKAVGDPCLHP